MHSISSATGYLIGLDLGERRDYTAIAVLRQHTVPTGRTRQAAVDFSLTSGTVYEQVPETEYQYDVVYLDRFRGHGYRAVVPVMTQLLHRLRQATHEQRMTANILDVSELPLVTLADQTGVGVAVVEDLRAAGLECTGITIHGGDAVSHSGQDYRVPKRELVGQLKVLVESKRIQVPNDLAYADILIGEMDNFRAQKKLTTGNDSYGAGADWRDSNHDDVVLATAMAAWYGETQHHDDWTALDAYARAAFG